jgi:radical SAM superfamily enzyme YgiQ (UPF0313 family)
MRPELPVIAGGPDCILHPRPVSGTKATVFHEAEQIIVPLVHAVLSNGNLADVPGIAYRDAEGNVRYGKEFGYQKCLDAIKFPRRELLRDNKGYSVIGKRASRNVTTIITSRGCPKKCAFCAHRAIAYSRYRARSAANVLAEIGLIARQGYTVLGIADDNFTADKARAIAILKGIRDMKPGLSIVVQGRVDAGDKELFALMKQAGVTCITFGLESGCQDVLDFYNKGTTVEQNARAIRLADKAGLYTAGLFILGAPFETHAHFERTYRFAASLPLDVTSFWVLDYTYGSALWERAYAEGKIAHHEYNVSAGSQRGTSLYPTEEIEKAAEKFFFRYYTRPGYWLRQVVKFFRVREKYFVGILAIGAWWLAVRRLRMTVQRAYAFVRLRLLFIRTRRRLAAMRTSRERRLKPGVWPRQLRERPFLHP